MARGHIFGPSAYTRNLWNQKAHQPLDYVPDISVQNPDAQNLMALENCNSCYLSERPKLR